MSLHFGHWISLQCSNQPKKSPHQAFYQSKLMLAIRSFTGLNSDCWIMHQISYSKLGSMAVVGSHLRLIMDHRSVLKNISSLVFPINNDHSHSISPQIHLEPLDRAKDVGHHHWIWVGVLLAIRLYV